MIKKKTQVTKKSISNGCDEILTLKKIFLYHMGKTLCNSFSTKHGDPQFLLPFIAICVLFARSKGIEGEAKLRIRFGAHKKKKDRAQAQL